LQLLAPVLDLSNQARLAPAEFGKFAAAQAGDIACIGKSLAGSVELLLFGQLAAQQPAEAEGVKRWALDVDCLYPSEEGGWCEYGDHLAALSAVTAERDRMRKDAERYRWLRGRLPGSAYRIAGVIYSEGGDGVDAAIDAAMAAKEA